MPRHQPEHDYVTSNSLDGKTWREIAEIVSDAYDKKVSIAGVRHTYLKAMEKLALCYLEASNLPTDKEYVIRLSRSEDFQTLIRDTMDNTNEY